MRRLTVPDPCQHHSERLPAKRVEVQSHGSERGRKVGRFRHVVNTDDGVVVRGVLREKFGLRLAMVVVLVLVAGAVLLAPAVREDRKAHAEEAAAPPLR